jgi:hypothetical protein
MAMDVSLGGFLLTREEWNALDGDERLMLLGAVIEPSSGDGSAVPEEYIDSYYESYEIIFEEKLAS